MFPKLPLSGARHPARAAALLTAVLAARQLPAAAFIRGDATQDGRIDITDPLSILNHLFAGVPLSCPDGGDLDDSGRLNISDPIHALEFLFQGGPAPAGPYPDPGLDPTPDSLPCAGEPDAGEEPALALTAEDLRDVQNAAAPFEGLPLEEQSGGPLQVDAQTFRLLQELRPGDSILDAPGLDGEALLAAFFQSRPTDGPLAVAVEGCPRSPVAVPPRASLEDRSTTACRWVVASDYQPSETQSELRQKVFGPTGNLEESRHAPPLKTVGAMEISRADVGPGPDHLLYGSRMGANCVTPATELGLVKSGMLQIRVNLVCVGIWGTVLSCQGKVEVEGIYRSLVEVGTSVGPECRSGPNRIEGLAQDEAVLTVNSSTLFQKAVAVQNGNTVTTTPSFSEDLSLSGGLDGLAAAARVHFGYSHSITHRTGRSEDQLNAFANAPSELPLTINLQAKGRLELVAHRLSFGRVKLRTLVAGVWLVGKTDCPVEAPLFLSEIQGEGVHKAQAQELARSFRRTRLGH